MRSVIDILDLTKEEIAELIDVAEDIIKNPDNYREKCKNKKLATHINRFAFQRYREIMQIDDLLIKKELYNTLRRYQHATKIEKSIIEQCMHRHLLFPSVLGFYIIGVITKIYSAILRLRQR